MLANDGHGLGHVVKMELGLLGAWWDTRYRGAGDSSSTSKKGSCFVLFWFFFTGLFLVVLVSNMEFLDLPGGGLLKNLIVPTLRQDAKGVQ